MLLYCSQLESIPVREHDSPRDRERDRSRDRDRDRDVSVALGTSPFIASDPLPSLTGVKDEYNPLRPNDYEELMKKRKEQKQRERDDEDRRRDFREDKYECCYNVAVSVEQCNYCMTLTICWTFFCET